MDETALRIGALKRITAVANPLVRATAPIYGRGDRVHPRLVGSAVRLKVAERSILVTAAHVLAERDRTDLAFGVAGEVRELSGTFCTTESGGSTKDSLDLAVFFLDDRVVHGADSSEFITSDDIFVVPPTFAPSTHLVVGYPATKQPRRMEGDTYGVRSMTHAAHTLDEQVHRAAGVDPLYGMLIEFDKKDVLQERGRAVAPDPFGMSGGGVWSVPDLFAPAVSHPKLAGIAIEWHRGRLRAFLATRIQPAIAVILRELPHARLELLPLLQ